MEQLKQGYKKTEVGLIPEDWKALIFKDICWVNQGLQIPITQRLKLPNKNSKVYITIQYLNDRKTLEYIDDYVDSVCCNKEDILMTRTGNTGIVVSGVEGVFHNNFFKINFDKARFNKSYLVYYLNQPKTKKIILAKAGTSTIPDLNHKDFYSIPVPVPTLTEQKGIADALTDVDELITNLEKLIAKKKAIKQGAMQQLLTPPHKGGKRLEGFSGDWVEKRLGEVGDCIIGLTYSPNNIVNDGTLVLRSSNIQNNKLEFSDNVYVNSKIPDNLIVKKDDILICVRNGSRQLIGKCAILDERVVGQSFGAFMSVFRSPYSKFIFQVFQSNDIKRQIDENLGATINQITNKMLNSFTIPFPSQLEQDAICDILFTLDFEISDLETKKKKFDTVKQGMMQELLTGKTRLI
jgi:type I restriction enzyme S subunit